MAQENLLYLDLASFEDGKVMRGGALVLGPASEPLEFRCTDAVRPTTLQKILWGARLDGYIATELFGKPLLGAMGQAHSLVVLRNRDFLDLRAELDVPAVHLSRDSSIEFEEPRKESEAIVGSDHEGQTGPSDQDDDGLNRVLTNPAGRFEPVVLRCHELHGEDMKQARRLLQPFFSKRDVMEPFERVATALHLVHDKKSSEQGNV